MNRMRRRYELYMATLNQEGSNKATSYVRALELLGPILAAHSPHFAHCEDLYPSTLRSLLSNSTPSSSSSRVWATKASSPLPSSRAIGEAASIPLHLGATGSSSLRSGMRTRSGPSIASQSSIRKNSGDGYSVNQLTPKRWSTTITSISIRAKAKRCCVGLRHA